MSKLDRLLCDEFENSILECKKKYDRSKVRESFLDLFDSPIDLDGYAILENYIKDILIKYLPSFKCDSLAEAFQDIERKIEGYLMEYKSYDYPLYLLEGINICYYWTPPEVVRIELYMCVEYDENGHVDWMSEGDFPSLDFSDLNDFGFPVYDENYEHILACKYLHVFMFLKVAQLIEKHGLNYVPFSTSEFCGSFDANLKPPKNAISIKNKTLKHITEKMESIKVEHAIELSKREYDHLPVNSGDFVYIPGGKFLMGSPKDEFGRAKNERLHTVLVDSYELMKAPISYVQYEVYCTKAGQKLPYSHELERGMRPVKAITFWDAVKFCQWLSENNDEYAFRLPTEAEWEYACRSGSQQAYWYGDKPDGEKMNEYKEGHSLTSICHYPPNKFGLYDMHGNAGEWCGSEWDELYGGKETLDSSEERLNSNPRVIRGGPYSDGCRSASRRSGSPDHESYLTGFRVVRYKKVQ